MKKLIKLHSVLNSVFYAVLFSEEPDKGSVKRFEAALTKILDSLPRDDEAKINVKGWTKGMFAKLTNDQINADSMIETKTSNHFYFEDHGSPTILFDYLKKSYIDWPKTLDEKSAEDEEFKAQYAFKCKDSFKTSLLSNGIKDVDLHKVYIFKILNYEPDVPYSLSQDLITSIETS